MILTKENIASINDISDRDKKLLSALLKDVEEFNELVGHPDTENTLVSASVLYPICITWQEWHDEYSPENLEAPDYYGCYRICIVPDEEDIKPISISSEMSISELDTTMCALVGYFFDTKEYLKERDKRMLKRSMEYFNKRRDRQLSALEKYQNYKPSVGDICMAIFTETKFTRISGSVSTVVITRIEGDNIYARWGWSTEEMKISFLLNKEQKCPYTAASHNDAFAIKKKKDSDSKLFNAYLVSKWMGIEMIDEFIDTYDKKKGGGQRYLWHSVQPSKVPGTTIMNHLKRIKERLEAYEAKNQ